MMQLIAFFITYEKLRDYIYYYYETGQFPDSLKLTTLKNISQKNEPKNKENCRLVSAMPLLWKVIKRIIYD